MVKTVVQADARQAGATVSPLLYGLFLEDLNYAVDGGLNANLLNNYSFDGVYMNKRGHSELRTLLTRNVLARPVQDGTRHWQVTGGQLTMCDETPLTTGARFGRVTVDGRTVLSNNGYPGGSPAIPALGRGLSFGAWIRSSDFRGDITVRVVDAAGVVASARLDRPTDRWQRLTAVVRPVREAVGTFEIAIEGTGTVDLDELTLVPEDHWGAGDPRWSQGVFRRDLIETLQELHPRFMRFPGGCIVEGLGLDNRYDWKTTVGPLHTRGRQDNLWASRTPDGNYGQSFQIGFYEYFLLCEDLGMHPIPVVNAGLACQPRSSEVMAFGPEFDQLIRDVLDLIDWATGDPATNSWAALRAEAGHPEPFPLRYLEIGNENYGQEYLQRFDRIRAAVDAHRPGMTVILSAGPAAKGKKFDTSWQHARDIDGDGASPVIVDEHYYHSPKWFLRNTTRYDSYLRRGPKVFLGEYAARIPSPGIDVIDRVFAPNTFASALAEAAYLTGIERNSDVVVMTSYAPLFYLIGHEQWQHNLIGFTPEAVLRTANFHVQSLFAGTTGDRIVPLQGELPDGVFGSSTATDEQQYVKLVNTSADDVAVELDLPDAPDGPIAGTTLSAAAGARNTIGPDGSPVEHVSPRHVVHHCRSGRAEVALPARTILSLAVPRNRTGGLHR